MWGDDIPGIPRIPPFGGSLRGSYMAPWGCHSGVSRVSARGSAEARRPRARGYTIFTSKTIWSNRQIPGYLGVWPPEGYPRIPPNGGPEGVLRGSGRGPRRGPERGLDPQIRGPDPISGVLRTISGGRPLDGQGESIHRMVPPLVHTSRKRVGVHTPSCGTMHACMHCATPHNGLAGGAP